MREVIGDGGKMEDLERKGEDSGEESTAAMELRELSLSYGRKTVLDRISFSVPKHKITAILGASGCGKTTLLKCLNGMIRNLREARLSGEILLNGESASALRTEELCRRVGLVFQTPTPFPMSIRKNMCYGLRYYGKRDRSELMRITEEKLRMAGLWEEVKGELDHSALKLSGGQQQRLCIARALTVEPEVLLLDEPCSSLDIVSMGQIEEMLKRCRERYSIILVTHNISQAKRIADEVVFLHQGRLLERGERESFFAGAKREETRAFLQGI